MTKDFEAKAAIAFASVAGPKCVELLAKRPNLACQLFNDGTPQSWSLVAVPPGVGVPGLIACKADQHLTLKRIDMIDGSEPTLYPNGLTWTAIGSLKKEWRCHETHLENLRRLQPLSHSKVSSGAEWMQRQYALLKWVAKAFVELASNWPRGDEEVCPPTAENLLGPDFDELTQTESPHWDVLGYGVKRSDLGQKAFFRHAAGYLTSRTVPPFNTHLWQIGTALADRLSLLRESERAAGLGLNVQGEPDKQTWAIKKMIGYSLHRLQGNPSPTADVKAPSEGELPFCVCRILERMKQFPGPESSFYAQMAFLLAMFAEGRAFVERNRCAPAASYAQELSGYASALLTRLTTPQFLADEELAEYLPPAEVGQLQWGLRRPAFAWYQLGKRLEGLVAADPYTSKDPSLVALTAGTRVLAVSSTIRAQVLELWALLERKTQDELVHNLPNPAAFGIEAVPFVHWCQQDTDNSVRYLIGKFREATIARAAAAPSLLKEITPLGWLVLLTWLIPSEIYNHVPALGEQGLTELAKALAVLTTKNPDRPWHDLEDLYRPEKNVWTAEWTDEMLRVLGKLDTALGLSVRFIESDSFSLRSGPSHTIEVTASDGTKRTLSKWQEDDLLLLNDQPQGEVEYESQIIDGYVRKRYRWSETWCSDRLVSVGVISPAAAKLVGLSAIPRPNATSVTSSAESAAAAEVERSPVQPLPEKSGRAVRKEARSGPQRETENISNVENPIGKLQTAQIESWSKRLKPNPRYARVALLQWEVDECYRHPLFDACLQAEGNRYVEILRKRDKTPWDWTSHAHNVLSCAEHRRWRILEAALNACKAFEVDILLLPEYSVRPDTIQHLLDVLPSLAPKTSVWAGTYRLPPGMEQRTLREYREEFPPWSAVLTAIPMPVGYESGGKHLLGRAKKYPSVSAEEVFWPRGPAIEPLFQSMTEKFDSRRYATELICSEVFLVTSPANMLPLARAYTELISRFTGLGIDPDPPDQVKKQVMQDFWRFAEYTDLQTAELNRRSIILVPAMTSRTADYAVLGQAGYLAAGLTMVFCNAVLRPGIGIGQSCFIGHDSWDRDDNHDTAGMPTWNPYHGITPGLFRPWQKERGWLGKEEQAMVIVDINPDATTDAKPRPQFQAQPLRLVAHLPIIESWKPCEEGLKQSGMSARCRCMMNEQNPAAFRDAADHLFRALSRGGQHCHALDSTIEDVDPSQLDKALKLLADAAKHSEWLVRRRDVYAREHSNNPQAWPPPVALDWLWVDLGEPGKPKEGEYPKIEIPPYCASGGRDRLK